MLIFFFFSVKTLSPLKKRLMALLWCPLQCFHILLFTRSCHSLDLQSHQFIISSVSSNPKTCLSNWKHTSCQSCCVYRSNASACKKILIFRTLWWRREGTLKALELDFLRSPGGRQPIWTRWFTQPPGFWLTVRLTELSAAHQQRRLVGWVGWGTG